ncbi:serine/threonine protein kinase, partial [Pyxidicoccus sp. 3LFB2]
AVPPPAHALPQAAHAVALKLALHPGDARFVREAELLSRVHHPAVPRLLDAGHWEPLEDLSYAWLVMEWVEGPPLYAWVQAQRPSSRQVLQLLARLARALDATHAAGGLHRDVKGDNVRIRRADAQPFLLDFGSGHYLGAATLTQEPLPPGTPMYRSPEAWRFIMRAGKPLVPYSPGPADDIFALGVTAYRLITEKYPPSAHPRSEDAWLWRPGELAHWTAGVCNPRCLPELSALVARMLSPHPEARGSAREVAEALEGAARRAGSEADAPLFTGEEPRPAGLVPLPQRVTVRPSPPLRRWQEPRPEDLVPLPQRVTVRPLPPLRRWPWVAAAGLAGALVMSAGELLSVSRPEEPEVAHGAKQEESRDAGTVAVGESVLTSPVETEKAPSLWASIAEDMPPKPYQGQRRPDSKGRCPSKEQVAINGGCWAKVSADVKNCDERGGFEHKGECYFPVMLKPRPATSGPAERDDSP